jgi:site-specific DNA-methyltransferase (adenine-specific)/modification methylase
MPSPNGHFETKPLSFVTDFHRVRPLNESFVERLRESIREKGYKAQRPLCVTPDGVLWDGNHRFEALQTEGAGAAPMYIFEPESLDRAAFESNEADRDALPQTFVDYAETVWRKLEDATQQEVADEMGWSRSYVKQYAALQKLDSEAWEVIGTTCRENALVPADCSVPTNGTAVPFTERLLRDIVTLTSRQQLELVTELADGVITKGKFKSRAKAYAHRNALEDHVRQQLGDIHEDLVREAIDPIDRGIYDKHDADSEAVAKLIGHVRDKWAKKNSVTLLHGDFFDQVPSVGAESVDLIVTDPPYNIANERVFSLEGRSDISQDFGEWDKFEHADFLKFCAAFGAELFRILRPGGSAYVFVADRYLSHLGDILEVVGFDVRITIPWHKTNPGTQVVKTTFKSSVEYILFLTKGEGHTFNWLGENEMHNHIEAPICGGAERLVDSKGNTLHPTQKPLRVLRHLIEVSSRPGDLVFDGFMGVGSTGHAAIELDRKFTGIEVDDVFFVAAEQRLQGVNHGD